MLDLWILALTLGLFGVAIGFVRVFRKAVSLMALDTLLGLAVSFGLAAYLFYVLARPERF